MKRLLLTVIISAFGLPAQAAPAQSAFPGAWSRFQDEGRPKLEWETLKGYRLFFHPDDPEGERRGLNLAVPAFRELSASWAIVRPLTDDGPYADAWLRVEGEPDSAVGKVSLAWNGLYRGKEFPDAPYRFEVNLKFADGESRRWDVLVLKSRHKPRLVRFAGRDVSEHRLLFRGGDYEPATVAAVVPRAEGSAAMIAQVLLPELPAPFDSAGILVQGRRLADAEGKPVQEAWDCLCQQALPADSPARREAKKVRCDWDLARAQPGLWDLRLALYHRQTGSRVNGPCDEPMLDEDRLRVQLLP
jgi:hypothetical protein